MKSPVSPQTELEKVQLEPQLIAFHCPQSGGHFLQAESYWRWLAQHPERLPHLPPTDGTLPKEEESSSLRFCPESGQAMLRYQVGHGFNFTIDRSPSGGIWFDGGEWEALRKRNFHDEIHLIFTRPWQNQIRRQETEEKLDQLLRERIGEEAFRKTREFQSWLAQQPDTAPILAMLHRSER